MGFFAQRANAGARRSFRLFLLRVKTLALYGAGAVAVIATCFALWESGSLAQVGTMAGARLRGMAADAGFRVAEVTLSGRVRAPKSEILARLDVARGTPVFDVDLARVRENLQRASWVRDAAVSRRLPDTIAVEIVERAPAALWRDKGRFYLVDIDGIVLGAASRTDWRGLPLISGPGAAVRAGDLISFLQAQPAIAGRVVYATLVGGRRWDLRMNDGLVVMLPEKEADFALARLARADARHAILSRAITRIDLRLPDRMVVQLATPDKRAKT